MKDQRIKNLKPKHTHTHTFCLRPADHAKQINDKAKQKLWLYKENFLNEKTMAGLHEH